MEMVGRLYQSPRRQNPPLKIAIEKQSTPSQSSTERFSVSVLPSQISTHLLTVNPSDPLIMKLLALPSASILALILGVVAAEQPRAATACERNDCKCAPFAAPGTYCGGCKNIDGSFYVQLLGENGGNNHVYECMGDNGCCHYGSRDSCPGSPCPA